MGWHVFGPCCHPRPIGPLSNQTAFLSPPAACYCHTFTAPHLNPDYHFPTVQNEAPSVVGNASCWALHMGLSSNFRYQALNGLDMVSLIWPVKVGNCCMFFGLAS